MKVVSRHDKFYAHFQKFNQKRLKKLSVTLLGLIYFAIFYAPMMTNIYSTKTELLAIFETLKNPAMIALVGPDWQRRTVEPREFLFSGENDPIYRC